MRKNIDELINNLPVPPKDYIAPQVTKYTNWSYSDEKSAELWRRIQYYSSLPSSHNDTKYISRSYKTKEVEYNKAEKIPYNKRAEEMMLKRQEKLQEDVSSKVNGEYCRDFNAAYYEDMRYLYAGKGHRYKKSDPRRNEHTHLIESWWKGMDDSEYTGRIVATGKQGYDAIVEVENATNAVTVNQHK